VIYSVRPVKFIRFAAVIGIMILTAAVPPSALAGVVFKSPDALTLKAPSRLRSHAGTSRPGASTGDPKADPKHGDPITTAHRNTDLPYTGLNLLPETLIGVALVGAGIALRARRT
jgi:hypothetical protein